MPRVVILTEGGERVGEVPVFLSPKASRQYGKPVHGWDGVVFERHWAEAVRRENLAAMIRESEKIMESPKPVRPRPLDLAHLRAEARRRRLRTGEFQEWLSPRAKAVVEKAMRRMVL